MTSTSQPQPIATSSFTAGLVTEYSAGPTHNHGQRFHEMRLYRDTPFDGHGSIVWNWGKAAADEDEEVIGLIFEGMAVVDYDGVFQLPREARALLISAGFDLSEIGYDAQGNEIPL